MKRILLPLALIIAVSAQAQITTNTKAKVDPKNNKVSNPVVEKPKQKLMTVSYTHLTLPTKRIV